MKTQVENIGTTKKKLSIEVPLESVKSAFAEAFKAVQKKAKLKGFREGKVPADLVQKQFGQAIHEQALEKLIDRSYPEAVTKESIVPISKPQVQVEAFGPDQEFKYSATFEIRPAVTAKNYAGLALSHPEMTVTEAEVDVRLAQFQTQLTQLEPVGDPQTSVAPGFVAIMDFDGTVDGKKFEGSTTADFEIDIGAGKILAEFENQLIGMKVGDAKTITFAYPADYFNKEMAGKTAEYRVTIRTLKKKNIPALNDDFAKDCGDYKSLADLKAAIRRQLTEFKQHLVKQHISEQAVEALVKENPFEVPETMILWELKSMYEGMMKRLAEQKKNAGEAPSPEAFAKQYRDRAADRVRGYLILDAIADAEKIQVTDEEVEGGILRLAEQGPYPLEEVRKHYESHRDAKIHLRYQILHEKVLDFVASKAKIEIKKAKIDTKSQK